MSHGDYNYGKKASPKVKKMARGGEVSEGDLGLSNVEYKSFGDMVDSMRGRGKPDPRSEADAPAESPIRPSVRKAEPEVTPVSKVESRMPDIEDSRGMDFGSSYVPERGRAEDAPAAKPAAKPVKRVAPKVTDTGDETDRLAARAPKRAAPVRDEDLPPSQRANSVPGLDAGKNVVEPSKSRRAQKDAEDAADKAAQALPLVGGALGMLNKLRKSAQGLKTVAYVTPRLSGPEGTKALPGPSGSASVSGPRDNPRLPAPKGSARSVREPKDAEDARYADEGNSNYAKGGLIGGGHGDFKYGKKC